MLLNPACVVKSPNFKGHTADVGLIIYSSLLSKGFTKEPAFKVEKENIFLYSKSIPTNASVGLIPSLRSSAKFHILVERITDEEYIISVQNRNIVYEDKELKFIFEDMFVSLQNKFDSVTFSSWQESSHLPVFFTSNPKKFRKLVRKGK